MHPHTLVTAGLASAACACSVWFAWRWYLPLIRRVSQTSIDSLLARTGEIGFDEHLFRTRMFAIEAVLLVGLVWLGWGYTGFVLGMTLLAIGYHLRGIILAWIIESRERLLRRQTLSLTTGLQGLVRGGLGLAQSIDALARETPLPLGMQLARVANDYRRGRPLIEALNAVRSSLRLDAFSLLVTSINCALKQGSSLEASLGGVQESLEHRDHAERQLSAKTSSARATILILSLTPPGFFAMFWLMQPDSMPLIFHTDNGKMMMAAILGLMYTGVAWAKRLLTIK